MVRLLFGGKTPQTVMSIEEISAKMPDVIAHLRVLVARHASIAEPLQKANLERQILQKFSELEDFASKFKTSFLNRIKNVSAETASLCSGMDLKLLSQRWPNPKQMLTQYLDTTQETINLFRTGEFGSMEKSYGLRGYASEIKGIVKSNVNSAAEAISQKILSLNKQIQLQMQRQKTAARNTSARNNMPKKQQQLKPRFAQ